MPSPAPPASAEPYPDGIWAPGATRPDPIVILAWSAALLFGAAFWSCVGLVLAALL